jgi:hypothetical protein
MLTVQARPFVMTRFLRGGDTLLLGEREPCWPRSQLAAATRTHFVGQRLFTGRLMVLSDYPIRRERRHASGQSRARHPAAVRRRGIRTRVVLAAALRDLEKGIGSWRVAGVPTVAPL